MSKENVLLKEYEVCQQQNNSIGSQYWVIFGIFMSVSTVLLGWLAYSIVSERIPNAGWPVFILGVCVILIFALLKRYFDRVNFIIDFNYDRMREIELDLDISKNWRFHIIDRVNRLKSTNSFDEVWGQLKQELSAKDFEKLERSKQRLEKMCERYPRRPWWTYWTGARGYKGTTGVPSITGIFYIIILLWMSFIILAFLNCQ